MVSSNETFTNKKLGETVKLSPKKAMFQTHETKKKNAPPQQRHPTEKHAEVKLDPLPLSKGF